MEERQGGEAGRRRDQTGRSGDEAREICSLRNGEIKSGNILTRGQKSRKERRGNERDRG